MKRLDVFRNQFFVTALLVVNLFAQGFADEPSNSTSNQIFLKSTKLHPEQRGPICGLLSMKVAIDSLGGNADLNELLSHRFLTDSRLGSSTLDLMLLAKTNGLQAQVYESLSIASLQLLKSPALLHLKTRSDKECGGHWVTFLGFENDQLIIYDSLKHDSLVSILPADLLTRWSGLAIVISSESLVFEEQFRVRLSSFSNQLVALIISLTTVFFLTYCSKMMGLIGKMLALFLVAIFAASIFHGADRNGVAFNWLSARWMTTSSNAFNDASFEDLRLATDIGNLVDARTAQAREEFQIVGAKTIGVDWDIATFREGIKSLYRQEAVVVFCNSRSCPWADVVGNRLKIAGFRDVLIFRRGVVGYLEDVSLERSRVREQ